MLALVVIAPFLLAGERVHLDGNLTPQFTANQVQSTFEATRAGLAKWAATEHGRKIIEYFVANGCEIEVFEETSERGLGRAPQPGIATLVAGGNRTQRRTYEIILNPVYFKVPKGMAPLPGEPASPADAMAIAWAGEMLHVYFYAQGISLPHHQRDDFQEEWQAVAAELGMPTVRHDDGDEYARSVVVRVLGRRGR
jgi:hypothetical protein